MITAGANGQSFESMVSNTSKTNSSNFLLLYVQTT